MLCLKDKFCDLVFSIKLFLDSSDWEGEGGISGLFLTIKKLGKQKTNDKINSDNK